MVKAFFLVALFLTIAGCHYHTHQEIARTCDANHGELITIWIHGTMFVPKIFWPGPVYFEDGLHQASSLPYCYYTKLGHILSHEDPARFCFDTFYLFGWSGLLSFHAREEAAELLLAELKRIVAQYQNVYHRKPFIRIITHSHGGNVALNVAKFIHDTDNIQIDELILLACPVQMCTRMYIEHPLFKKIYSLYSLADSVQVLDPQGMYQQTKNLIKKKMPFFSERIFPPSPKLTQLEIRNGKRGIMHIEYILPYFVRALPDILHCLEYISDQQIQSNEVHIFNLKTHDYAR